MQRRTHPWPGGEASAIYSECGTYRSALARDGGAGDRVLFVMLNPSTATELANDPTIARVEGRARAMGFSGVGVVNLFALRATDPAALARADDPVGPGNDAVIAASIPAHSAVICAWGAHPAARGRTAAMLALLRASRLPLWHLGLTRGGAPRHPLYLPKTTKPQVWD